MTGPLGPNEEAAEIGAIKLGLAAIVAQAGGYLRVEDDEMEKAKSLRLVRTRDAINGGTIFRIL
jgi:hypothetical protein